MMKANKIKFFTNLMGDFLKNLKTITTFKENKTFQKVKECMGAPMRSVVVFTKITILTFFLSFFNVDKIEAQCSPNLAFKGTPFQTGVFGANGSTYLFTDVAPGIDALVTLVNRSNATLVDIDFTTGSVNNAWQPRVSVTSANGYIDWRINFQTRAGVAVPMGCFSVTALDIDGLSATNREWIETTGYVSYTNSTGGSTVVPSNPSAGVVRALGGAAAFPGPSTLTPTTSFQVNYGNLSQFTIRTGNSAIQSSIPFSVFFGPLLFEPGRVAKSQGVCGASIDADPFTNEAPATSSAGTIEYKWASSTTTNVYNPSTKASWTDIAVSTATYDPPSVSVTTNYVRLARISSWTEWQPSNVVTAGIYSPSSIACNCSSIFSISGANQASYSDAQIRTLNTTNGTYNALLGDPLVTAAFALALDTTYKRLYYTTNGTVNPGYFPGPYIYYMDANGKQYNSGDTLPGYIDGDTYNRAAYNPVNKKVYFITGNGANWVSYLPSASGAKGTVTNLGPIRYLPASTPPINSLNRGGDIAFDFDGNGYILTNSGELYQAVFNADNSIDIISLGNVKLPAGVTLTSVVFGSDGLMYVSGRGAARAPGPNDFNGSDIYKFDLASSVNTPKTLVNTGGTTASTLDFASCNFPLLRPTLESTKSYIKTGGSTGSTIEQGDTLEYSIIVKNTGKAPIGNVKLSDILPANIAYLANTTTLNDAGVADISGFRYSVVAGDLINSTTQASFSGVITPQDSAVIKFRVRVLTGCGTIVNIATVTSGLLSIQQQTNTISLNALPFSDAGLDKSICTAATTIGTGAIAGNTYSWTSSPVSMGLVSPSTATSAITNVRPTVTTQYFLAVTQTAGGCVSRDTVLVTVDCAEICNNNRDDDGDGLIDCADADCGCTGTVFTCDEKMYMMRRDPADATKTRLERLVITGGNPSLGLVFTANMSLNGLGYFNGFLYAIANNGTTLYRIDGANNVVNLGTVAGLPIPGGTVGAGQWSGGTIDVSGNFYLIEGFSAPNFRMYKIPLLPGGTYTATQVGGPGPTGIPSNAGDVAIDASGVMYAWVQAPIQATKVSNSGLYTINLTTGAATKVGSLTHRGSSMGSLFTSDDGKLYGYGCTDLQLGGYDQNSFFQIDKITGAITQIGSPGTSVSSSDGGSCPWRVDLKRLTTATCVYPGASFNWDYIISNQTGSTLISSGIYDTLDTRFSYDFNVASVQTTLRGMYGMATTVVVTNDGLGGINNVVQITGLQVPVGSNMISLSTLIRPTSVFTLNEIVYEQAYVKNLPSSIGAVETSDNPATFGPVNDASPVTINIAMQPQITGASNLCINAPISLDANTITGVDYSWDFGTGATPLTANTKGAHNVTYNTTGSKRVILTVTNGACIAKDTLDIAVTALPTPVITATETSCTANDNIVISGDAVTLTASGGTQYAWSATPSVKGVSYEYFSGTYANLPNFGSITPIRNGIMPNFSINIPSRPANDFFAMRFRGNISIATTGTYTFYTNSDDGSKLYIDGVQIVDNDGLHGPQEISGTVSLTVGSHTIEITYFENSVGETLDVSYAGPGVSKQIIPSTVLTPFTSNVNPLVVTPTATTTYNVTVTDASGCSATTDRTITVNPTPSVTAPSNQSLCAGAATTAVSFSGTATTYTWANNTPSIGLAASGTGNIASFTALNTTGSAIIATITVTPVTGSCSGSPITFTITVNPRPSVTAPSNQSLCAGAATAAVSFSGTGTTYEWTNNTPSIGLAASGTGNIGSFTAVNTTGSAIIATIMVTPVTGTCSGTPVPFTITVNPTPSVTAPSNQNLCVGQSTTAVGFSGSAVSGTVYNWVNNNPSIGLAASGTGDIASFVGTNTTNVDQVATITVTPRANGCDGTPRTFTITVKPRPTLAVANEIVCNGTPSAVMNFTSPVAGTTYTWTNSNTAIGLAASGNAPVPSFNPTNTGGTSLVSTINVTPTANGCLGTAQTFTITANPSAGALPPSSINSLLVNFGSSTCSPSNFNANLSVIGNPFGAIPPLLANCPLTPFGNFFGKFVSYNPKDNKIYYADISTGANTRVWILDVGIQSNISCPTISALPSYTYVNFKPNNFEFDANGDVWALTGYNGLNGQATMVRFDEMTGAILFTKTIQFPTGTNALTGGLISSGDLTILPNGRMFATLGDNPSKLYEITDYASGASVGTGVFLTNLPAGQNTYGIAYINGNLEITGTNTFYGGSSCYYYEYNLSTNTLSAQRPFQYGQTPIDNTSITPAVGVTKQTLTTTMVNSTTADMTYELYVKNTGNVLLNNINVTDNLGAVFGAANISNVSTSFVAGGNPGGLILNPSYNGTTNTSVFNTGQQLSNDASGAGFNYTKFLIQFRVSNLNSATTYLNSALASGNVGTFNSSCSSGSTMVIDTSNNGPSTVIDPNNDGNAGTNPSENIPTPFKPLEITVAKVDVTCPESTNGTSTVTIIGGTGPFSYAWSTTPAQTTATATNLSPGTYSVTVSDSRNVLAIKSVTVIALNPSPVAAITGISTICGGGTGTSLTASGGTTYAWSTLQNAATISVNPAISTTYTVTVTSAVGCKDTEIQLVTVNPTPTAPSVVNRDYCINDASSSLTATGTNLLWYSGATGGTGSTSAPTPTTSGAGIQNYWVSQTVNGCESARSQISVTVNETPAVAPVAAKGYCVGDLASPMTAVGTNLLWYSAITGGTGSTTAPTPPTTSANVYNYWVSQTLNGCESPRRQVTAFVNNIPVAPTVTNRNYCVGATAPQLTVTSTTGVLQWYTTATGGTGSTTAPTPNTSGVSTQNFWVTQTLNDCESPRSQITVTINAIPSAPVVSPISYCEGATSVPLTVTTGVNLQWYTSATGGVGISTAPTPTTIGSGVQNYWVSQTVNGCESARSPLTVTVNAMPSAPSVSNLNYCVGATAPALTAIGTGLLWYTAATGGTGSTTAPTPSTSSAIIRNYWVSQTVSGCESPRSQITVTINAIPSAPLVSNISYCVGATAVPLTITSGSTTGLLWYSSATGGLGSSTAPTPSTASAVPQNYWVSRIVGTCESPRSQIIVTINAIPTAPTVSPISYCEGATAVPLTVTTGVNLQWYTSATGGVGISTAPTPTTIGSGLQNYWVSQTVNGCESARSPLTVTVNAIPAAPSVSNLNYCVGATAPALTATGTGLLWYTAATGGTGSITAPTPSTSSAIIRNYWVSQTVSGCESPRSQITVTINAIPSAPLVSNISYCVGATAVPLTITSGSTTGLLWYSSATGGLGSSTAPTPSTASAVPQNYWVSRIVGTCESPRSQIIVTINAIPTAPTVSPISYCEGATAVPLTVTTGVNLQWYTSATGGVGISTAPTPTTIGSGLQNYWVSQTVNGCESARSPLTVTVNAIPAAPSVSNLNYCVGATAPALTATGTGLLWYTAATGGTGSTTAPTPSTSSAVTQNYWVSQTVSGCESARSQIIVTINSVPSAPLVSNISYCVGATAVPLTITSGSTTGLLWYSSATGGLGSSTAPTPTTASAVPQNYWVSRIVGTCESPRSQITVTINPLPNANISAVENSCIANDDIVLSGDNVTLTATGGTSYNWAAPSTGVGLSYEYFSGSYTTLPNFNTLTPVRTGIIPNFNIVIPSRPTNDYFAFRFRGYINITTPGLYTFFTSSDDGSKLYINGAEIVNNDGLHGSQERSGTVTLPIGLHAIEVTFFENGGGEVLEARYQGPGIAKQIIPNAVLTPFFLNTNPLVVVPTSTTTYRVTVTDVNGCTAVADKTITVSSSPNVNVGQDIVLCSAPSYNLVTTPPTVSTGTWSKISGSGNLSGNTVSWSAASCNPATQSTGSLLREKFTNITGNSVADLTANAKYPSSPDVTTQITQFASGTNEGDYYGDLVRGYIRPTVTGNYIFTVTGDDNTQLYLSTTSSPNNKALIASVNTWSGVSEFTKEPNQVSASINLVAGQNYYVELLHKEGSSGDHFQVYWQTPTNGTPTIVPAANLVSYCSLNTVLKYSVTNGGCVFSDTLIITNTEPMTANAGLDLTQCGNSTFNTAALDPGAGTGIWTKISGPGAITDPSARLTTVTGVTEGSTTVLQWTVTNSNGCILSDNVTFINKQQSVISVTPTVTTYCENGNVSISGSLVSGLSGGSWSWTTPEGFTSGGQNLLRAPATPSMSGIYTLSYTTSNGCVATATSNITVTPTPTITTTVSNQAICAGNTQSSISISGTATTYNWANNRTNIGLAASGSGDIPSFTAVNTTSSPIIATITVTPMTGTCTGAPITFTITVNPTPLVSPVTSKTLCAGSTQTGISFSGTAASYTWTNSDPSIGLAASGTGNIPSFTATNSTNAPLIATIVVTPTTGPCSGTPQNFTITVNPSPSVNLPSTQVVCAGETQTSVILTSSVTGTTYTWTNSNTAIGLAGSGSGNIPSFTAVNTTGSPINATITLTPATSTCSGTPVSFTITVNPIPAPPTVAPVSYCKDITASPLTAIGNDLKWYALATGGVGNASAPTPSTTSTGTQNYWVSQTINGCESARSQISVTVHSLPTAQISGASTICGGTSVALTASGGVSYQWSTSGTTALINDTPSSTTTYTVTVTDANGCKSTYDKTVNVLPTLVATAGADQLLCTNTFTVVANTPDALETGSWSVVTGSAIISLATSATTDVIVPLGTTAKLRWTITKGACSVFDDVILTSGTPVEAGNSQTLCSPSFFTMAATPPATGTGTWSIITGSATISNINSPTTQVTVPLGTVAVLRWTINQTTCASFDDVVLTNYQTFTVNAGVDQAECNNPNAIFSANSSVGAACAANLAITNGSFEDPLQAPNTFSLKNASLVSGWKTTASDNRIEFWGTGFNGVPSQNGSQFVELNASVSSGLYQDLCVLPGDSISWSIAHRGRAGVDRMDIKIGVPGALVTQRTVSTGQNWVIYTGTYKVPLGQTVTRFQFEAVSTATGNNSVGNFIDNVQIGLISRVPILGSWSILSGTATITSPTNPSTTVTGVPVGQSVTMRWTSSNGVCTNFDDVTYTNYALPTVNAIANQTVCGGTSTSVNFSGNATGYSWVNSNTAIGLSANGTGNIGSFVTTNTTNSPIISTITVTPLNGNCTGVPVTFTITVNPNPSLTPPAPLTVCNGTLTAVSLSSSSITTYTWVNNTPSIGLAANGSGNIPSFTATNTGTTAVTATITITPMTGTCAGTPVQFTIMVNPTPTVSVTAPKILCVGETQAGIDFTGTATAYNWTNNSPSIGLAGSGTGNIPSFITTNVTSSPIVATIRVTPIYGTCPGTPRIFTITVNPIPTAPSVADVCYRLGDVAAPLTATGIGLKWYTSATGGTGSSTAPTPTTSTSYWVSQTVNGCESPRAKISVIFNNAGFDQVKCNDGNFILLGATLPVGTTGQWNIVSGTGTIGSLTTPSTTITGVAAGTKTILEWVVTNGTCVSRDEVEVWNNNVNPIAAIQPLASNACVNTPLTFTATSAGAGATYTWSFVNATPASATTQTVSNVVFLACPSVDNVTLTVMKDACQSTTTISVRDVTGPVFVNPPANVTVDCGAIPSLPTLTITDCDPTATVSPVTQTTTKTTNGTCTDRNYTITRRWTATDNCANTTTHTQIIAVVAAPDVTIASNGTQACVGATVVFTSSLSCASGSAQTYQWQSSLNGITFSNIPSANLATYDAISIAATTHFRLVVTQGACSTISTPIMVTVAPKPTINISADNLDICTDGTATITTSFTGGLGTCQIIWQKSINNGATWNTIVGQNGNTLPTGQLDTTTKYKSIIQCTGLGCCSN
jgi:hypothetical protein